MGPQDFDTQSEYEVYLLAVAVNALEPKVTTDLAFECILNFILWHGENEQMVTPNGVLGLVEDMLSGPTNPQELH